MREAIENRDIYIDDRVKGSGMIILQEEDKEVIYILEPGSKEIDNIEKNLRDTINTWTVNINKKIIANNSRRERVILVLFSIWYID